jgi:hypothetical protein
MKLFSSLVFFLFFVLHSVAQDKGYDRAYYGLNMNHVKPSRFVATPSNAATKTILIECPFASAEILNPAIADQAKGQVIEKVQLVYTTYRSDESFSQQKLNQQRLKNLQRILPDAFSSSLTEWELVGQTAATNPEEGHNCFHGFAVTYRVAPSETTIKAESDRLDSLYRGLITVRKPTDGSSTKAEDGSSTASPEFKKSFDIPGEITHTDGSTLIIPRNIPNDSLRFYIKESTPNATVVEAHFADSTRTTVIVTERFENHKRKREWKLEEHRTEPGGMDFGAGYSNNPDSVVITAIRRNGWTNYVMVCDVTSSMSPYTAQIFAAMPSVIENRKCKGVMFFNDGDGKTSNQKRMGKSGGIYFTRELRMDSTWMLARKCMARGNGGDLPENNVEALLQAEKSNPGGELVLVADNWASPRDLSMCDELTQPVHVILCCARGGVNPDYLFLARVTGGSVHLRDEDITNLPQMKEGETVKIGIQTFLLHDDHFIPMENFSKQF